MKFLIVCVFVSLSTQCNSRSILDMETELSEIAVSSPHSYHNEGMYPAFAPNYFAGAPSALPMIEASTGVYQRIANNIAEKLTTPLYKWFGIKSTNNPDIDDPNIDILTRRRSPIESEMHIIDNSKVTYRRSFTVPTPHSVPHLTTRAPRPRQNYLTDAALLKLIAEEDAAKGITQPVRPNTNDKRENKITPPPLNNTAILKFIEELKKKYKAADIQNLPAIDNEYNNMLKNPNQSVFYNKRKPTDNDSKDKDKKDENSNSVDVESKNVENYLNNGGEVINQEDASINNNVENTNNNKDSVEQMLKYLLQINPTVSTVSTTITNSTIIDTDEVPFNLSTVFDIPSTLTTKFVKIRVDNDDDFEELGADEGQEINVITILQMIGGAVQLAFGAIKSMFGRRKQ